ncbi:MAG: gamma carbonic anhydrase family protein [Clostridiales bacterium]|nr:gamma carbonic anhydrase family protein [Clostridiales bacterium]
MIETFKNYTPKIHEHTFIAKNCSIIGQVVIREQASIWYGAVLRGDIEKIIIKKGSNVQDNCVLHCSENIPLIVGENTTIGHGAILHSCNIGSGCLIGMGSTILDGVVIGDNCLIGANALVTQNQIIKEGSLVVGSPAKVKRLLSEKEILYMHENTQEYIKLMKEYNHD